jgi:hypothetical protein
MHDASAQNHTVGSDHLSDGQGGGNLNDRDACFFEFRRDRSAAARARASGGCEDDCVDAVSFDFFRHLPAEATCVRQWIGAAAG